MDTKTVELVKYNLWANARLIDWLESNDEELIKDECQSSFVTILETVEHILNGQILYFSTLLETEYVKSQNISIRDSYDKLLEQSKTFVKYVESQNTLNTLRFFKYGHLEGQLPQYELIQHCVNHSTFHRGQIITMAHQLRLTKAPSTDMLFYFIEREKPLKQNLNS